jgi:hypothetical protein
MFANVSKLHHQRATDNANYYEPSIYTDDEGSIGHLATGRHHSFAYHPLKWAQMDDLFWPLDTELDHYFIF